MTTGKIIALTTQTFVSKVKSLLFNMLSGIVRKLIPVFKPLDLWHLPQKYSFPVLNIVGFLHLGHSLFTRLTSIGMMNSWDNSSKDMWSNLICNFSNYNRSQGQNQTL